MGMEQTIAKNDQYTGKVDEKINVTIFLFFRFENYFYNKWLHTK